MVFRELLIIAKLEYVVVTNISHILCTQCNCK